MNIRIINAIVFIVILMLSCQNALSKDEEQNNIISTEIEVLKTTLDTLNIDKPDKDLDKNTKNNDLRFICVCGYACYAPGITQSDLSLTEKYGIRCIDGTSDMIVSDEHERLKGIASEYAEKYNGLLLKEIKEKP